MVYVMIVTEVVLLTIKINKKDYLMAQIESALREMMEEGLVELGADENDEDIYSLTGKGIELESTGEITKEKGGEKHG
tara:strand:+ start:122 stop:355 length:234 start_codon:yes stop_codon:yes gene_type:complete